MTPADIAEALSNAKGYPSESTIRMYERGDRIPPVDMLIRIADFLCKPIDYFVREDYQDAGMTAGLNNIKWHLIELCSQFNKIQEDILKVTGNWRDAPWLLLGCEVEVKDADPQKGAEDRPLRITGKLTEIGEKHLRLDRGDGRTHDVPRAYLEEIRPLKGGRSRPRQGHGKRR